MWGGVLTHELDRPFLSPTVNLFILPKDFIRMLSDLHRYIEHETLTEDAQVSAQMGYPAGLLGDIRVWFVHYTSFEQAKGKWVERCTRIRWDALYIMMVQRDGCTEDDLLAFDKLPYAHKVVFTVADRLDLQYACHIPGTTQPDGEVMDLCRYKGLFTGQRWIDDFDYVSFLNKC